jgi:hypothetical protein
VGRLHRQLGWIAIALAAWCSSARVFAHTLPISYLFVVTDVDYVHLELSFNPFELASFSEFDTNKNGRLDPDEIESQGDKITRLLLENLTLLVDGKKVAAENAGISPDGDSHHATLRAHYRVKARHATITVESNLQKVTSSSHLTQVNCLRGGERQLAQLDSQSHKATFKPAAATASPPAERSANSNSTQTVKQ